MQFLSPVSSSIPLQDLSRINIFSPPLHEIPKPSEIDVINSELNQAREPDPPVPPWMVQPDPPIQSHTPLYTAPEPLRRVAPKSLGSREGGGRGRTQAPRPSEPEPVDTQIYPKIAIGLIIGGGIFYYYQSQSRRR